MFISVQYRLDYKTYTFCRQKIHVMLTGYTRFADKIYAPDAAPIRLHSSFFPHPHSL